MQNLNNNKKAHPTVSSNASHIRQKLLTPVCLGLSFLCVPNMAHAAGFEILKPHRAIYNVTLNNATKRSGITSMDGRIVYEMTGNECEGMTVNYRFVSNLMAHGDLYNTDQQSSSYESADGSEYSFLVRSIVNDQLDTELRGLAKRNDAGLAVSLLSPNKREVELEKAKFLSTHLVEVLKAAREGKSFFTAPIFDAGDQADEVLKTTNLIGKETYLDKKLNGENDEIVSLLVNKPAWSVNIGYFGPTASNTAEQIADYEISFWLYEGGISRNLSMRYPDYSLNG
ncbi:MAG: DUF1849 family protein, partial [Nitratireductor sp.]